MAQLLYKTRAGSTPQGKPRVYFACHEDDYAGYFQGITDEILKISDCAIFYYEPGDVALDEDYYLNLSQMNLMVMPVTTWLLYKSSRAMDVEFSYAVEHHIPVLPLMQERGLEEKYSEKFGDLQFLDKTNADPTAIPYAEKLKKYLESVLIGDELAQKIRAAFDAYVFLSYRKKDRKYAQELMHLLHRDPVCRDIAIWYDEFLTPGENFNDSIKAALEKSGLFVLAVTPNLVNETNYIMTTEYPMAKDAGKPILPAEMVKTNPASLRNCYPEIPESVNPKDEKRLTDTVLAALGTLAREENDNDPKHNFFIGLAYLTGIDVEVNHERAVELITGAAEAGLPEAMEKLVQMYGAGEGVAQNEHLVVHWQEKLLEQAAERYEASGKVQDGYRYMDALLHMAQEWWRFGEHQKADDQYRKLQDCAIALSKVTQEQRCKWYLAVGYRCVAGIYQKKEEYQTAREHLVKAKDVWLELGKTGESYIQHNLALVYQELGDLACYSCGYTAEEEKASYRESAEWYQKALKIYEKLAESGNVGDLHTLASFYEILGSHHKFVYKRDDVGSSWTWLEMALKIRQNLANSGTSYDLRKLANTYETMARGIPSWREEEKEYRLKALEIREQCANESDHAALWALADAYWHIGQEEKAVQIAEKLSSTGVTRYMKGLAEWYCWLADKEWDQYYDALFPDGMLQGENLALTEDADLVWENKHLALLRRMAELDLYEGKDKLIQRHIHIGNRYSEHRMFRKSIEYKQKALELREEMEENGDTDVLWKLMHECVEFAATCSAAKETAREKQLYEKAVALVEALGDPPTEDLAAEAALAYLCVAEAENDMEKMEKAKRMAELGNAQWLFSGDLFS